MAAHFVFAWRYSGICESTSNLNLMGKSPLILAALAKAAVPSLDFSQVKRLSGSQTGLFDSALLTSTTGNHYVVRTPAGHTGALELDVETQVLKSLTPNVRAKLPFKATSIIGEMTDSTKNRVVVFEFLYGSPVDIARLASNPQLIASIGAAIGAIHRLDTELIRSAGLPEYSAADVARLRVNELDAVALTGKIPGVLLQRWQEALEDVALFRFNPTVVHGELSDSTVLEQDRNVSAVLNWGAMHIGDPAEDFAWLAGLRNIELMEEARSAYSAETQNFDSTLIQRAVLYNELAHASWLLHGTKIGDQSIVEEATINLEILEEEVNQGAAPSLSAAGFATLSQATGAFVSQEPTTDSIVEVPTHQELIENIDEVVVLDDKTREIELPKKSDDELF